MEVFGRVSPEVYWRLTTMRCLILFSLVGILLCIPTVASAQKWADDFDTYKVGPIVPQSSWLEWATPSDGFVTTAFSKSSPNSVEIQASLSYETDLVHPYLGYTTGHWTYRASQYIPTGFAGDSYFILLNTWIPPATFDWSVQLGFNSATGNYHCDAGSSTPVEAPFIYDQWVEIRVEIYLDQDWVQVYYNDVLLDDPGLADHPIIGGGYTWTLGVFGSGTAGQLNLGAVDLFANKAGGMGSVYYDDMSIEAGPPPNNMGLYPDQIQASVGGITTFSLDAGMSNANRKYGVFGSISGTGPTMLPGGVPLPLTIPDLLFTTLISLGLPPLGILNSMGTDEVQFALPPFTVGMSFDMYFAFACPKKGPLGWFASNNAVKLHIVP